MINPSCLIIAGSDSGAGAGLQADLKTFSAHNIYASTVITAVTAQNTIGVNEVMNVPSYSVNLGDDIAVREKSKYLTSVSDSLEVNICKSNFLEWDNKKMQGKLISIPTIDQISITDINQQLIVELYSK